MKRCPHCKRQIKSCPYCGRAVRKDTVLRKIRSARGISAAQAAREIGVPLSTWYSWESGTFEPSHRFRGDVQAWIEKHRKALNKK